MIVYFRSRLHCYESVPNNPKYAAVVIVYLISVPYILHPYYVRLINFGNIPCIVCFLTQVLRLCTVFALRNSPAAPSGTIWKLPQMSGRVRRNVNIVNHQPVNSELAMSL